MSSNAPSSPSECKDRTLNWLCYAIQMLIAFPGNVYPVLAVSIASSFGLNNEQIGRVSTIILVGAVVCVLASPLAKHVGVKPFVLAGCALTSLGFAMCFWSTSYAWVEISFFCAGFGVGLLDIVNSPTVAALNPRNRVSALSYLQAFYCAGVICCAAVSTVVLVTMSWRAVCFLFWPVAAVLGLIMATRSFPDVVAEDEDERDGAMSSPESPPRTAKRPEELGWMPMISNGVFLRCGVGMFCAASCQAGSQAWLPTYVSRVLHFSDSFRGSSLMLYAVTMMIGRLLGGAWSDRIDPRTLICVSAVTTSACVVIASLLASVSPVGSFAMLVLIGFCSSILWPVILGVASSAMPTGGAKMFAVLCLFGYVGGSLQPWLIGWVSSRYTSLVVSFALNAIPGVVLLLVIPTLPPPTAKQLSSAEAVGAAASRVQCPMQSEDQRNDEGMMELS